MPTAPGALILDSGEEDARQDPELGIRAQLIESPNLDRFLRKAQDLLDRRDYSQAIHVLQDAIEGRVVREAGEPAAGPDAQAGVPQPGAGKPDAKPGEDRTAHDPFADEDDPGKAVYSADGRLYRPVLRLCHELLGSLPPEGLELYRAKFEVEAERAFQAALDRRDARALEALFNRFYATDAGARAQTALADILLDAGRYRAAAEVLRGVRGLHPRFRDGDGVPGALAIDVDLVLAVSHAFGDEPAAAAAVLREMAVRYPGASVRVMGELLPVSGLTEHPLFAAASRAVPQPPPTPTEPARDPAEFQSLIPLWQHVFAATRPYSAPTQQSRNIIIAVGGEGSVVLPAARLGEPGNTAVAVGDALLFMEHNRVLRHELATGRLLAEGDGSVLPYRLEMNSAPPRVAAYDFATMRVVGDGERIYAVLVPTRRLPGAGPALENRLVALDAETFAPRWMLGHDTEIEASRALTFLATPTVFQDRLLVPVLVRGMYALQAIEAKSGALLFRTPVHAGGTDLVRAPGCHVVVDRDTVLMMTNAGAVAAIDAYSGIVRWIRRYERLHPFRTHAVKRGNRPAQPRFGPSLSTVTSLPGFPYPSEPILHDGQFTFAPVDGRCLMSLDTTSGEVVWMLSLVPGDMDYVVGHDAQHLFVVGRRLTCVELRTGIRRWDVEVPEPGQGRGVVTGGLVVLPGERRVHVIAANGDGGWRSAELPRFLQGQDPFASRANLELAGPYLVAVYAGGVEVYGAVRLLRAAAAAAGDPASAARLLMQAGDLGGAADAFIAALQTDQIGAAERVEVQRQLLPLVSEVAVSMAVVQQREMALALLERCRGVLSPAMLPRWHLTRAEVFRTLRDLPAAQAELDAIRDIEDGVGK